MKTPAIVNGFVKSIFSSPTACVYEANSARAVSAAEAMAKPLPTAAVVLPTESS